MGLSRTVSEKKAKGDFCQKSQIFPTAVYVFTTPAEGVPLGFCNGGSAQRKLMQKLIVKLFSSNSARKV